MTKETPTIWLPEWIACEQAVKAGTATALQRFIYDNEPSEREDEVSFRSGLVDVIVEALNTKIGTTE